MNDVNNNEGRWYSGITRYQWLVLAIACLCWGFDVFEGQLFALFKTPAMADLLGVAEDNAAVDWFGNAGFASFLFGGALGGLLFGMLADRIGRRQTMVWSILTYSAFTGLHFFASSPWQIVALRFLVAMGVAGGWAVGASLVAEVFQKKNRTIASAIFHAAGILGVAMAAVMAVVMPRMSDWRPAFLIGVLPALLAVWVLVSIKESEKWEAAKKAPGGNKKKGGSLIELFGVAKWRNRALIGLGLASVGLGTYWGILAWTPELAREVLGDSVNDPQSRKAGAFAYLLMNVTGGLVGQLAFAPITMLTGRRIAFAIYLVGSLIIVPIVFLGASSYTQVLVLVPIMGFFVIGIHAGWAIYFPELFPTHLRATGTSFCFNVGRLVSAGILLVRGEFRDVLGLRWAVTLMASLFLVGLVLLIFAPETKDQELPE